MKSFKQFFQESKAICNKTEIGVDCPVHGKETCPKLKIHKTPEEIAIKHRLKLSFIETQLEMGIPIEHEHTKNKKLAMDIALQHLDEIPDYYSRLKKMESSAKKEHKKFKDVKEEYTRIQSRGSTYSILLNWRGKYLTAQMFFPQFIRPTKKQVTDEVRKIYPNAIVLSFNPSIKDPTKPLLFTGELNGSK